MEYYLGERLAPYHLVTVWVKAEKFPKETSITSALQNVPAYVINLTTDKKYWEVAVNGRYISHLEIDFEREEVLPYELLPILSEDVKVFGLHKARNRARDASLTRFVDMVVRNQGSEQLARYLSRRSPQLERAMKWATLACVFKTISDRDQHRFCRTIQNCNEFLASRMPSQTKNNVGPQEIATYLEQRIYHPMYDGAVERHHHSLVSNILTGNCQDLDSTVPFSVNILLCGSIPQVIGDKASLEKESNAAVTIINNFSFQRIPKPVKEHLQTICLSPPADLSVIPYAVSGYASPFIASKIRSYIKWSQSLTDQWFKSFPRERSIMCIMVVSSYAELHSPQYTSKLATWISETPDTNELIRILRQRLKGPQNGSEFLLDFLALNALLQYRGVDQIGPRMEKTICHLRQALERISGPSISILLKLLDQLPDEPDNMKTDTYSGDYLFHRIGTLEDLENEVSHEDAKKQCQETNN